MLKKRAGCKRIEKGRLLKPSIGFRQEKIPFSQVSASAQEHVSGRDQTDLIAEACSTLTYAPELANSSLIWQAKPRASGLPHRQKETRSERRSRLFTNGRPNPKRAIDLQQV